MGADNPTQLIEKPTIAELLAEGDWTPGAYRSDTVMVVHIPADRSGAYLVSIPRDSYVRIYDSEGDLRARARSTRPSPPTDPSAPGAPWRT